MSRRAVVLTAAVLAGCGGTEGPSTYELSLQINECVPAVEENTAEMLVCADYQTHLEEFRFGFGDTPFSEGEVVDEKVLPADGLDLPVAQGSWRPIRDDSAAVLLKLRAGESDDVDRARKALRANKAYDVLVMAERDVKMSTIASLYAEEPAARWQLVVRKSHADVMRTLYTAYPRTTRWARRFLEDCLQLAGEGPNGAAARRRAVANAIAQAAGKCRRTYKLFMLINGGAALDVIGPAAVQMIRECQCELSDLDAFVPLLAYYTMELPETGGVMLLGPPASGGTVDAWLRKQ